MARGEIYEIVDYRISQTQEGNTYVLVNTKYGGGMQTLLGDGTRVVVGNPLFGFKEAEHLSKTYNKTWGVSPQDIRSFGFANEGFHVDFSYEYSISGDDYNIPLNNFFINGFNPTIVHAMEYLSDVNSIKQTGVFPSFLLNSYALHEPYNLQFNILITIIKKYGIIQEGDFAYNLEQLLKKGITIEMIISEFISYEDQVLQALEKYKK